MAGGDLHLHYNLNFDMIAGSRKINGCIISIKRFISNSLYLKWDSGSWQAISAKMQPHGHNLGSCGIWIIAEISRNFRITCSLGVINDFFK